MNTAEKFRQKHRPAVYRAINEFRLPEDATGWPILECKVLQQCMGSGESSQFGTSAIARLDGKRVAYSKASTWRSEIDAQSLGLAGKLRLVSKSRDSRLYVLEPEGYRPPRIRAIAWTGGSVPPREAFAWPHFNGLRRALFREQMRDWRDYWKDCPSLETCRLFWNRAKLDAWATVRGNE